MSDNIPDADIAKLIIMEAGNPGEPTMFGYAQGYTSTDIRIIYERYSELYTLYQLLYGTTTRIDPNLYFGWHLICASKLFDRIAEAITANDCYLCCYLLSHLEYIIFCISIRKSQKRKRK